MGYIKKLWKKKKNNKSFISFLDYITDWYFLKPEFEYDPFDKIDQNKLDQIRFKKFRDFIRFTDMMHKTHVPVKLIICEPNGRVSFGQKLYAQYKTDFGALHVGLQVGPYIIDWRSSEIIIPRPLKISKPLIILNLPSKSPCTQSFFKNITDIIWNWNLNFRYDLLLSDVAEISEKKKSNCHGFVKYFQNFLSKNGFPINLHFYEKNGPIQYFMDSIRRMDRRYRKKSKKIVYKDGKRPIYGLMNFQRHRDVHDAIEHYLGVKDLSLIDGTAKTRVEKVLLLQSFCRAFFYGKRSCKHINDDDDEDYDYKKCPLLFYRVGVFSMCRKAEIGGEKKEKVSEIDRKKEIEKEKEKEKVVRDEIGDEMFSCFC